MGRRLGSILAVLSLACSLSLFSGCKPTYPKCEKDEHCTEKGEVCVNGQCQECRDEAQCTAKYPNEKRECNNGRCDLKPECRADADCTAVGPGLVCKSNKCVPECAQDADCPTGKKCAEQKCVATAACSMDIDCGPNRTCADGVCQDAALGGTKVSSGCRPMDPTSGDIINLDKLYFDFDKYELSSAARDTLTKEMECIKQAPPGLKIVIEGHADQRGTQEYNLALGEKRANVVLKFLKGLGADSKKMSARSKGKNEPVCEDATEDCWAKNRRVQFIQKMGN